MNKPISIPELKPANEYELKNVRHDFKQFLKLDNNTMKAAYNAVTGRGFNNMIMSMKNGVLFARDSDNKFMVCSYDRIIDKINVHFHVDASAF